MDYAAIQGNPHAIGALTAHGAKERNPDNINAHIPKTTPDAMELLRLAAERAYNLEGVPRVFAKLVEKMVREGASFSDTDIHGRNLLHILLSSPNRNLEIRGADPVELIFKHCPALAEQRCTLDLTPSECALILDNRRLFNTIVSEICRKEMQGFPDVEKRKAFRAREYQLTMRLCRALKIGFMTLPLDRDII